MAWAISRAAAWVTGRQMSAAALLAALALGIAHAPAQPVDCAYTVPVLALDHSQIMSGNMRTTDGGCLVWLNLSYASALRRKDVCQLGAHELAATKLA
jgi:hypothetical protein